MGLIQIFVHNKLFILLTLVIWFVIGGIQLSTKFNKNPKLYQINPSTSNLNLILKYLLKLNINPILIDPSLLNYLFIQHLPLKQFQKRLITFGIINDTLPLIHPLFSLQNFSITISKNLQQSTIDHIFIEYNQQIIHLAVLHKRESYFLIEKNTAKLSINMRLPYGDTLRVIIESDFIKDKLPFSFPRNVSHFLWLYNTSEFIECNRNLANEMENKYHLYQNATQLNLTITPMRNIADGLNKFEKHHWLAGGTLLGKK